MPDIRLRRADDQRAIRGAPFAEHRIDRFQLDRIAERRARSVGLDEIDPIGSHAGDRERAPDDGFLGRAVRHCQAAAAHRPD